MANTLSAMADWLSGCPQLRDLLCVGGVEDVGASVLYPLGSSEAMQYTDGFDINGDYECNITPFPSVYEDYQLNCYRVFDSNDKTPGELNINLLSYEDVQAVCDWIAQQDDAGVFPAISGRRVVAVECVPFVPQIAMINEAESRIAYFVTVRLHYVNPRHGRSVTYAYIG